MRTSCAIPVLNVVEKLTWVTKVCGMCRVRCLHLAGHVEGKATPQHGFLYTCIQCILATFSSYL